MFLVVASSCLRRSSVSCVKLPNKLKVKSPSDNNLLRVVRSSIAALCISFSFLMVPENPDHFASICQRHNSVSACQVW